MAANFCMNCGSRLKPGARFCENCGAAVPGAPDSVNPLKSGAIPAVGSSFTQKPEAPKQQAASDAAASNQVAASPQSQEPNGFAEQRTQLIGMKPVASQQGSSASAAPSQEDLEREEFHEAEIKSGTWNESSPASYRVDSSSPEDFTVEETRVIGWSEQAPDGTCTVPFASKQPEASDLFEPPEVDLSGFDVPAQPRYDLDDGAVAAWGANGSEGAFAENQAAASSGWEDDRPAGYTAGLKREATTQMPADVDPMAGVKRSDTMVMDPVTAQSVYSAPSNQGTVYSAENTARRGNGTKIAVIVIAAIVVFVVIYLVQFNPYFIQNIQYDLSQWAENQGSELLSGFVDGLANIVNQIGIMVR